MQTPDTPRGRETERLMALWRQQNPDADSSAYNREWESVYGKLEFLDGDDLTQGKLDWLWNHLREMGCRTFEEMTSEDHMKLAEAFFTGRLQFDSGRQRGFLDDLADADRRFLVKKDPTAEGWDAEIAHTPPKPRKKPKRICKANYPATKGAFGKPKHLRLR